MNSSNIYDNRNGIGSTPNNANIDYLGFETYVNPRFFLNMVPSGFSDENTKEYVKEEIKKGNKISPPTLWVKWDENRKIWIITGHEGRSRTVAFTELFPDDKIKLHVIPSKIRARDITEDMKKAPFFKENAPESWIDDEEMKEFYVKSPKFYDKEEKLASYFENNYQYNEKNIFLK